MSLIDLSAYLWPEDVTGRLPRLGRRFDPTHRLNSGTTYTLYGGELYGPNNQSLAVPPLEAGLTVGLGAGGIGLANSGASANGLNYGLPGRYLSDTGGVFHVTTTVTLTGGSGICSVWGSSPEHYQHIFSVGADGSIVFGVYNDYSNVHIKSAPVGTVPMGRATTISAYWQAGVGILIAVDGKLCTSYSNVWVQGNPASVAWSGQCWGGKLKIFAGASGTLHYLKIQNAVRTAKDLIEISRNPNDLFESLPDLPFSLSAAGGGGTQTLTPPLHTNSQSFYSPAVSQSSAPQSLTASLFTSSSTIFVPTVQASKALSAGLFSNANTLYSPTVTATKTLATSFYSNAQVFYPPAVSVGAVSISPSLYSNTQTFYPQTVSVGSVSISPPLYSNTQTFYPQTVSVGSASITPSLYSNTQTFYPQTVSVGAVSISPPLYSNAQVFYAHVLNQVGGPQNVAPLLLTNSATFYSHTLAPGSVAVVPSLFSNSNAFYSLALTASKTLTSALHTNTQAFYPPAVSVGSASITPSLYSNTQTFYAHVLNQVGGPQNVVVPLFNNTQTFYSPLLSPGAVSVAPSLYANAPTFYGLTVTTSKTLTASLFSNASELYEPLATLAGGPLVIAPSLFSNTASFFTHTVASGLVQLYPVRFDSASVFYAPAVSTGSFSGSISDADITRIVQAVLLQLNNESIAAAVWNAQTASHVAVGTFGKFIKSLLTTFKFLGLK